MGSLRPAGPYPLPGIKTATWIARFDDSGACASPATQAALFDFLSKANKTKNVVLFSHGWQTDFGDAADLYTRFLMHFEKALEKRKLKSDDFVFVGVTWPSKWLPDDKGLQMAAGVPAEEDRASVQEVLAAKLANVDDVENFYKLSDSVALDHGEANALAKLLLKTHPQFGQDEGAEAESISSDNILQIWGDIQTAREDTDPTGLPGFATGRFSDGLCDRTPA